MTSGREEMERLVEALAPHDEADDDIAHSPLLKYTYGKANAMHKAYAYRQGIAPDPQGTTNPTSEVDDRCKVDYAPLFGCGQVNPKTIGRLEDGALGLDEDALRLSF